MPETQLAILETQLRSLDAAMDQLRAAAALDFACITQFIKNHFENATQGSDQRKSLGAVIHELQYYDLLHQSIDHIQELHHRFHQAVADTANLTARNNRVNHPLAQLNRLQFEVCCLGLNQAVEDILRLLRSAQTSDLADNDCFTNHNTVLNLATRIAGQFHELAGLCDSWPISDVQSRMNELNTLYSTAVERTVLEHFIKEPGISAQHLVKILQHTQAGASTIDLF